MRLICICAAAVAGLAIGDVVHISPPVVLLALLGATLVSLGWPSVGLAGVALCLGLLRAAFLPAFTLPFATPDALATARDAARLAIIANLPEPQASLASGVLLGGSGHLDPAFKLDLQRSGLSHFLAIDGFKQVVLAATVAWLAGALGGRRAALLTSVLAVGAYTFLVGAHPSAVRAALMVGLARLGMLSGRLPDPLTSLSLAALGMALVDPRVLLDLGLQLSLSATLGIIVLWPELRRSLHLARLPRCIGEPLGLTLAVSVACLPVSLSAFGVVSLDSPFAHMVAVPLLAPVMFAAALLALVAVAAPPLAPLAAWIAWLPASLLAIAVHAFGSAPGASLRLGHLPLLLATALAALLLGYGLMRQPEVRLALTTSAARRGSAS